MYRYTNIFFIFILYSIAYASDPPNYCQYYQENEESFQSPDDNVTYCFDGKEQVYSYSQLAKMMTDIKESTMKSMAKNFKHLLAKTAYEKIREKRNEYIGLYDDFDYSLNKELQKCDRDLLGSDVRYKNSNSKIDLAKQKDILILHLINALKVDGLFKENKNYYKKHKEAVIESNQNRNKCQVKKRTCENKTAFWRDTYHCQESYDLCLGLTKDYLDSQQKALDENIRPLYEMIQKAPLLFENKIESGFFAGMLTENLSASDFQKKIIAYFPHETIKDFERLLNTASVSERAYEDFFSKNSDVINGIIDDPKIFESLIAAMKKESQNELERLDEAASAICKASGEMLHLNQEIVAITMDDYFGKAKNQNELKNRISFFQASHCFLLQKEPATDGGPSVSAIGGMALLGIGGAMQLIPIVGNVAGSGLIIAGASLSVTGGGTLAILGLRDGLSQTEQLGQSIGLYSVGMGGYKELLQKKENRDGALSASAVSMVLLPLDLWGLNYISNLKKMGTNIVTRSKRVPVELSRRLNIAQREVLDELDVSLGAKRLIYLDRYVGLGPDDLSKPDQIYLGAIAQMVEEEIKKSSVLFTAAEKKFAAQHVMDDVIKKCVVKNVKKVKGGK